MVQQAGALRAAQETASATREAAETAATNAWWAAILALCGAIFGGFVAWRNGWLQTRTTQQIKHADFRQEWIDKLREEMARFTKFATENDGTPAKQGPLRESLSVIVLRMDKDDPDYEQLLTEMGKVADESAKSSSSKATHKAIADFLVVSQRILKREWEVTKNDMHATPWGRPFSWIATWARRRRRAEEKEIVRRTRENHRLDPPREIKMLGWSMQWRRRQIAPPDPKAPLISIGRLELRKRHQEKRAN